jgi:hypothetical protein
MFGAERLRSAGRSGLPRPRLKAWGSIPAMTFRCPFATMKLALPSVACGGTQKGMLGPVGRQDGTGIPQNRLLRGHVHLAAAFTATVLRRTDHLEDKPPLEVASVVPRVTPQNNHFHHYRRTQVLPPSLINSFRLNLKVGWDQDAPIGLTTSS